MIRQLQLRGDGVMYGVGPYDVQVYRYFLHCNTTCQLFYDEGGAGDTYVS